MKKFKVEVTVPLTAENSLDAYKKIVSYLNIPFGGYYFIIHEEKDEGEV